MKRIFPSTFVCFPVLILFLAFPIIARSQEESTLPSGLEEQAPGEPSLPLGLGYEIGPADEDPTPPPVLKGDLEQSLLLGLPFDLTGFWEARAGVRTQNDPFEKGVSIGETRLKLRAEKGWDRATFRLTSDILYDPVLDRHGVRLEQGRGLVDIREASLTLRAADFMDIKVGRQILTWGTGDLVFINDLFPKDWNSFFIGRDTEYLKGPSDAVKVSLFSDFANLDLVYTPRFDADRFIDGKRVSFYNSSEGRRTGRDVAVLVDRPNRWFRDEEIALRLYRNIGGYEAALYAYRGFWKSPGGQDRLSGNSTFPALTVYGASVRGPGAGGIVNLEAGIYQSEDDVRGDDHLIKNGQLRLLAGFEREAGIDFTVGLQYYLERMLDYGNYLNALPAGSPVADKNRHLITLRLTKLAMNQNMILSLFAYYSPSDSDAYLRPKVRYKVDDHWSVEAGCNLFQGSEIHTFFGQFQRDSNVYMGARYGF